MRILVPCGAWLALAAGPSTAAVLPQGFDERACASYRAGEHGSAITLWELALGEAEGRLERARLLYNLGNASYRSHRPLEAVGWYTAALRLSTRDPDLWANLELARADAGLQPADRGNLPDTVRRVLSAFTRAESEWLVLLATGLLAACLAGEALRGGLVWRRLSLWAVLGVVLSAAPLQWNRARASEHPLLVIDPGAAAGRSEPSLDAKRLRDLDPGSEVELLDRLPGWAKVATDDGQELWVRDSVVFDLVR